MRTLSDFRTAAAALTVFISSVAAQQPPAQQPPAQQPPAQATPAPTNPHATLPYAAPNAQPVSPWTPPASAGRQLTLQDLLSWKSLGAAQLSFDGKWFGYLVGPNEGDADVFVRPTAAGGQEWKFAIGNVSGGRGGGGAPGGLVFSGNGRWVAFTVFPPTPPAGRGGRGGAAAAQTPAAQAATKLAVVDLRNGSKREFERVRAYRFAGEKSDVIALHHMAPGGAAGAAAAGAGGRAGGAAGAAPAAPEGTVLQLVNLADSSTMAIGDVAEFAFDESGNWLAYATSVSDLVGNSVQLRQLSTGIVRSLTSGKAMYRRLVWGDSSTALAVVRVVTDTSAAGNDEEAAVLAWSNVSNAASKAIEITAKSPGITGGLVVSSDRTPEWGDRQGTLFFGLRELRPPRPRQTGAGFTPPAPGGSAPGAGNTGQVAAAPQTDENVPSLILWHWKDPRLQAQQQVQEATDRSFSYLAAWNVAAGKAAQLSDAKMRTVAVGPKSTWAVGTDITGTQVEAAMNGKQFNDLYAVNVATGERKALALKMRFGGGGRGFGAASPFSPDNSQYAYYDDGNWKIYDFNTGAARNITAGVPTKFWNVEDDHNIPKPPASGVLGWATDGSSVFLRDNWDVWRVPASGTGAVNITGNGQKDKIRYQTRLSFDPRERSIDLSKPMYFETYGEWSKKEGLSEVDPVKGGAKVISWEDNKVDYRRARDADVWTFARQTFTRPPDWYAADAGLTNERRLTDLTPQMKDVAWSPGGRLIEYTCENGGGKRQAALYLPAGYQQGKKYPMLTYIYEKLTQGFYAFNAPNATRYANPSVYTSRGYAFLMPDIVYHVNDPGRSAVWCVVPAVKAAIATGIVDPARVGLQGHSWGGYQTSFITTQTRIFKTAIAGAPLTDMVSMFGSVYWNSGGSDASIFISSQGRFTGGPNEVPEAYIRNSPQQFAQNLSMPFMILHNDRDGAVDFNQGITYYNHLRQLGKEVMLLEYVGENHGLSRAANQKDYALRMTEWFDTFLRDQPAPEWLKEGVPRIKMEEHLKERRVLVDPKAEVTRPRITP